MKSVIGALLAALLLTLLFSGGCAGMVYSSVLFNKIKHDCQPQDDKIIHRAIVIRHGVAMILSFASGIVALIVLLWLCEFSHAA